MNKTIATTILFALFLVFGAFCSKSHQDRRDHTNKTSFHHAEGGGTPEQGHGSEKKEAAPPGADLVRLSADEVRAIDIRTVRVGFVPVRARLQAMGKVSAPQTKKAIVSYAFPARIAEIHIAVGEWVKAGQRLVTLQSEEVGTAKTEYSKARADYELALRNMEREKSLFNRGIRAQKNLQATEAEYKVAEANLKAADKKLHILGFSEDQVRAFEESHEINPVITLFSPLAGKVIESKAVLGSMIDQSTEILVIIDPTVLWIDAEIFERDIAKIKPGLDVEISVPAYPNQKFKGRTSYIGDILNEETRTITVRAEIQNRDYRLKPGMFADMTIFLGEGQKVLALPLGAVLEDRGKTMVFVRVGDGFRPQPVDVGAKADGHWEILSGVAEGDEVVMEGNFQLKSKLYGEILKKSGVH